MARSWSDYYRNLVLLLLGLLGLGFLIDEPAWTLVAGLGGYLLWTLLQVQRLHRWLQSSQLYSEPPRSLGLWGDLFYRLYRAQQAQQRVRDQLQTLINRVQESTNTLRDAVIMTNAHGNLEWWNLAAEHLLGLRRPSDTGQYIGNLIRVPAFRRYFDEKRYEEPLEIASPLKPHIRLQVQINLFGDEDRLIVVRDVTRIYQLEQMRRDFVSNVSHEMRTPLTVIGGYLETLTDHLDELPRRWRRPVQTMAQQTQRMDALITDLILLAKLETEGRPGNEKVADVPSVLASVRDDAVALSGERGHQISLRCEAGLRLRGDEQQLRSAFSNLVFNAVKYTPDKGRIDIHWWQDEQGLHLSVSDNGLGFDPIHIPRLTERFYRADPSRHKETGGTGLGLAIVKHALRNHDGTLEIRSAPGKGSTFTCHFPAARGAGERDSPKHQAG